MAKVTKNKQIAWLESQRAVNIQDKEQRAVIDELIRTVQNPCSFPVPEKIELWSEFVQAYMDFHHEQTNSKARIKPTDGKKLKEIIYFVLEQDKITNEEEALNAFKYVLNNWHKLSQFLQSQVSLAQIEKNLSEILKQLKSGHHKSKQQASKNSREQLKETLARRRQG